MCVCSLEKEGVNRQGGDYYHPWEKCLKDIAGVRPGLLPLIGEILNAVFKGIQFIFRTVLEFGIEEGKEIRKMPYFISQEDVKPHHLFFFQNTC